MNYINQEILSKSSDVHHRNTQIRRYPLCRRAARKPLSPFNQSIDEGQRECATKHKSSRKRKRKISQFFGKDFDAQGSPPRLIDSPHDNLRKGKENLGADDRLREADCPAAQNIDPWSRLHLSRQQIDKVSVELQGNQEANSPQQDADASLQVQEAECEDMQESQKLGGHFYGLDHLNKFGKYATAVVDKAAARHGLQKPLPSKPRYRTNSLLSLFFGNLSLYLCPLNNTSVCRDAV